jgi:hypothetical protein
MEHGSQDISVSTVMDYGPGWLKNRGLVSSRGKRFLSFPEHPDRLWGSFSPYPMGTGSSFSEGKMARV